MEESQFRRNSSLCGKYMDDISQAAVAVSIFSPHDRPGPFKALAMPCEVEISVASNMQ